MCTVQCFSPWIWPILTRASPVTFAWSQGSSIAHILVAAVTCKLAQASKGEGTSKVITLSDWVSSMQRWHTTSWHTPWCFYFWTCACYQKKVGWPWQQCPLGTPQACAEAWVLYLSQLSALPVRRLKCKPSVGIHHSWLSWINSSRSIYLHLICLPTTWRLRHYIVSNCSKCTCNARQNDDNGNIILQLWPVVRILIPV